MEEVLLIGKDVCVCVCVYCVSMCIYIVYLCILEGRDMAGEKGGCMCISIYMMDKICVYLFSWRKGWMGEGGDVIRV